MAHAGVVVADDRLVCVLVAGDDVAPTQVRIAREQSSANLKSRIADSHYELIPIDHGFCLPETLEAPYFEWLHWPQAMLPFSEEELAYIRRIDIEVCVHRTAHVNVCVRLYV